MPDSLLGLSNCWQKRRKGRKTKSDERKWCGGRLQERENWSTTGILALLPDWRYWSKLQAPATTDWSGRVPPPSSAFSFGPALLYIYAHSLATPNQFFLLLPSTCVCVCVCLCRLCALVGSHKRHSTFGNLNVAITRRIYWMKYHRPQPSRGPDEIITHQPRWTQKTRRPVMTSHGQRQRMEATVFYNRFISDCFYCYYYRYCYDDDDDDEALVLWASHYFFYTSLECVYVCVRISSNAFCGATDRKVER